MHNVQMPTALTADMLDGLTQDSKLSTPYGTGFFLRKGAICMDKTHDCDHDAEGCGSETACVMVQLDGGGICYCTLDGVSLCD